MFTIVARNNTWLWLHYSKKSEDNLTLTRKCKTRLELEILWEIWENENKRCDQKGSGKDVTWFVFMDLGGSRRGQKLPPPSPQFLAPFPASGYTTCLLSSAGAVLTLEEIRPSIFYELCNRTQMFLGSH